MENKNVLLKNIDKLHSTKMGVERIKRNLKIEENDVIQYCRNKILSDGC